MLVPTPVRYGTRAAVAAADHLAAQAGFSVLALGGSAADAAVAASAAMAVTTPHLCGMGGDLFALVHDGATGAVTCLNASGRAGSGADADALRDEGLRHIPARNDIRSTPVPGCIDGWLALLERHGQVSLDVVLGPAIELAGEGFPASPTLAAAAPVVRGRDWTGDLDGIRRAGDLVRRPGVARLLRAVVARGRDGFYGGEPADALVRLGAGLFNDADLALVQADWVQPLALDVWGHRVWTVPPASQGYLTLGSAWLAEQVGLPGDPDDPAWAHLLVEASRLAGWDREDVLFDGADGGALVSPSRLAPRAAAFDPASALELTGRFADGDTTYLCAVDAGGLGVSLIQSNAGGFGSGLGDPATGISFQNRAQGFSLVPGHPAEYGPGRRPPHTLCPALVTDAAGRLRAAVGTMGGDGQPHILLQVLARWLAGGASVAEALAAGRFLLRSASDPGNGFATWREQGRVEVLVEGHAAEGWATGLADRGHDVVPMAPFYGSFGHAQLVAVDHDRGVLEAGADPRSTAGGAIAR